ncbi:hypothetical protein EDC96DRAFT_545528 [Choanephora cucurbitarum]|nr:hypothetical protein EDC96DRAFT_545528 [Choanephora cucurbitarum]
MYSLVSVTWTLSQALLARVSLPHLCSRSATCLSSSRKKVEKTVCLSSTRISINDFSLQRLIVDDYKSYFTQQTNTVREQQKEKKQQLVKGSDEIEYGCAHLTYFLTATDIITDDILSMIGFGTGIIAYGF